MGEAQEERLNVYDADGRVVGTETRAAAKASGRAVGAVNLLLADREGRVLLQRRPSDKENGDRWDKSVGGHVGAGEDFDDTVVREAREELFDGADTPIRLAAGEPEFERLLQETDLRCGVALRRVGLQLNLRDVRLAPRGGLRNVVYHVGLYLGRTDVPAEAFRPQPSEIVALRYFAAAEVDRMLLSGELAPNMAFLWLSQGHRLLLGASP